MQKTISGVAVVGGGYWGKNLIRNFAELDALRVVCDIDRDKNLLFCWEYTTTL